MGFSVHEEPYIPNEGRKGTGDIIKAGMVFAIEPMFTTGSGDIELKSDGYTYVTSDNKLSAQYEHTVLITDNGPEILTRV